VIAFENCYSYTLTTLMKLKRALDEMELGKGLPPLREPSSPTAKAMAVANPTPARRAVGSSGRRATNCCSACWAPTLRTLTREERRDAHAVVTHVVVHRRLGRTSDHG